MPPPTRFPNVLLHADFSQPDGAWEWDEPEARFTQEGGALHAMVRKGQHGRRLVALPHESVTIDVDITKTADAEVGVVCRASSNGATFYSLLTSETYDKIDRDNRVRGVIAHGDFPRRATAPAAGQRTTLHLHAECIGRKLRLYVNGTPRIETSNTDLVSGDKIGLIVDSEADVLFDNLEVRGM